MEDDAVGADRAGDLHRVAQRRDATSRRPRRSARRGCRGRARGRARRGARPRRAARGSGRRSPDRGSSAATVRGLCVKTCSDSAPIASARSTAVWMPPADGQVRADVHRPTLAEPRLQPRRLVLDLAAGGAGERRERRRARPCRSCPPSTSRRRCRRRGTSASTSPFLAITALRSSSGRTRRAVVVREQRVVPLRQEAHGRGRVGRRERRARDVEQLASVLVAEAPQRLERVERGGEVGDAEARPVGDVGARRRAEGARGSGGRARCARRARPSSSGGPDTAWKSARGRVVQSAVSGACRRCACRRTAWKIRRRSWSSSWPCALEVVEALLVRERRLLGEPARARQRLRARGRGACSSYHVGMSRSAAPEHRVVARA